MGDKEIKSILKEAREQIKAKEFKGALKEVKKVLNKDKNNYMALVFCGLCLSELEQPDQALQAYKRATESSPDQLTAWEGMCKFYEKYSDKTEYRPHHIECLRTVLQLVESDPVKGYDVSSKLAQLQLDALDLEGAVTTLQSQAQIVHQDQEKHRSSLELIVKVLSQQTDLSEQLCSVFEESLDVLLTENNTVQNMENLKQMIKLLYKMRKLEKLLSTALKMTHLFPQNTYPLEWICKIYLEWVSDTLDFVSSELSDPCLYYETLLGFSPHSTLGKLAKGAHKSVTGDLDEGISLLSASTEGSSPNVYGLYLLTQAQFNTKKFSDVEISAPEALKYLDKVKEKATREKLERELRLMNIKALYQQGSTEKLEAVEGLVKGLNDLVSKDHELGLILMKVYSTLGKEERVSELKTVVSLEAAESLLIEAMLQQAKGNTEAAKERLLECQANHPDNFEVLILLGRLSWEENRTENSLAYFLKAAKIEPGSWVPFLYLGHYYKSLATDQGLEKARKCYQKCLQLNPHEINAGKGLSDIYRETGKLQENLTFLSEVTSRSSPASGKCTWAWLRLGVHYLATDQPSLAVQALQSALRGDSSDLNLWEALADAYMSRGSYTAALKAFEKVLKMNPENQYASLMIASIKDRVGKWQEAKVDYKLILENHPQYLPALRGLGECLLSQAQSYLEEYVDKNAVDCIEEALGVLTTAAELKPSLHGTWRLIGDCCLTLRDLPSATVKLRVPSKLVGGTDGVELIDKIKVMELGSRSYIRALNLCQDNWRIWHQLGILYSSIGKMNNCRETRQKALSVMKHVVNLAPTVAAGWTSLGVVACQCEDWALAQHCFIKSLQLEVSAAAWTHLGVVYLHLGHAQLANRAFKEAQNQEPSNLRGWAGQALVAEVAGFRSESMDLFRHCTFLGGETESALGYGNWVVSTLKDLARREQVESHNKYIIEKMHGVAVAADSLTLYCRRKQEDSLAFCQLSVLFERLGLLRRALEAAERARSLLEDSEQIDLLDKVMSNIGRLNAKLGKYEGAVEAYKSIRTTSFYSQVGLALSYFALKQYQESYETYKSCLHWLAESDSLKSDILVAMGTLAYKVEGPQVAKTLLFQSCQMTPASVRGILALCVLGIQSSDLSLIDAALAEMKAHENDPRHAHDIAFLRASVMLLKGDMKGARRSLLRAVHNHPWLAGLWRVVSVFLLLNSKSEASSAAAFSSKAGAIAQEQNTDERNFKHTSIVKGFNNFGSNMKSQMNAESLLIESLCLLSIGDRKGARRAGAKLCHLYPDLAQAWAILSASGEKSSVWVKKSLEFVQSVGDGQLSSWAARQI